MAKSKAAASSKKAAKSSAGNTEVKVCRRTKTERRGPAAAKKAASTSAKEAVEETELEGAEDLAEDGGENPPERRKVQRRRQIDPTTCERDYTNDEIEFMHALDAYKRANGRMFPTCSEILEVVRSLGYERVALQDQDTDENAEAGVTTESEVGHTEASAETADAQSGFPGVGQLPNATEAPSEHA